MQDKKTHGWINVSIALAIIVAVIVGGYFYSTRDRVTVDLVVEYAGGTAVEGDLLSALGQLKNITLDDSIFANPVFRSLTDFSTVIPEQPSGRQNPFAPIGTQQSQQFSAPITVPDTGATDPNIQ